MHLGAYDERNRGEVELEQTGILNNQSIGSRQVDLAYQPACLLNLPVGENCIKRNVDFA